MINLKDKIILAVKTVIANEASVETEDGKTIGLYLESNDVDHIAEQVADDLSAEENRIRRDTVREFVRKVNNMLSDFIRQDREDSSQYYLVDYDVFCDRIGTIAKDYVVEVEE